MLILVVGGGRVFNLSVCLIYEKKIKKGKNYVVLIMVNDW